MFDKALNIDTLSLSDFVRYFKNFFKKTLKTTLILTLNFSNQSLTKLPNTGHLPYQTEKSSNWRCSMKKLFSKKYLQACNVFKVRLQHNCFPGTKPAYGYFLIDFTKWFFGTMFLDSCFQNHPDSVMLQKYQPFSN